MSLAGLLAILDDDPQLQQVVTRAESDTDSAPGAAPDAATLAGEDLIAPPALRPVLAAVLAGAGLAGAGLAGAGPVPAGSCWP